MFTGIVTGTGRVIDRSPDPLKGVERLVFEAPGHVEGLALGGSIAVNGACVSAVQIQGEILTVELIPETLKRTTFGEIQAGDRVNLERCLPAGARLDGHVVQGHVDGIGTLLERDLNDGRHRFGLPAELAGYLAEKGSIAIDGVSLTVTAVATDDDGTHFFEVGLIPTTLSDTTLGQLSIGAQVNLEIDVLAKYAKRMLEFGGFLPSGGDPAQSPGHSPAASAELPAIPQPETPAPVLDPIETALAQLRAGRPVVVVDDADRENEGDLILPAQAATAELMGFMIRHTSGVICAPMSAERARHLGLPPMVDENTDPKGTAYTISADATSVTSTGISAEDRAITARAFADPGTGAEDLTRPGHMFPLIANDQGVLGRDGHTEAAVDLCRLAGYSDVGIIAELNHDDGTMMRLPALREFADEHGLALISIADLIAYRGGTPKPDTVRESLLAGWEQPRENAEALVSAGPVVNLPTEYGVFDAQVWTERTTGHEHMLLSAGTPLSHQNDDAGDADPQPPLVRLHSECLTGDVLGSHRCDCGTQLVAALETIQREGGHLLYLRGHEGRGIGLANKMRAYKLQEEGADTVEANEMLGLAAEMRDYTGAAAILHASGIRRVRLLTNNPAKVEALASTGLEVSQVPSAGIVQEHNERYLRTKRDKMRHLLDHLQLDEQAEPSASASAARPSTP
ncbi:3,4-dihydroxy-2-butanone-4-phosphate synthase [Nesterenkonia flava]|uniref:GTP cyclohydrolase-2 n=1 Tax=Nesterenkonia flava TaxID=469799 RepID=A0ABU1FVG8_9MICC|nr:3,4-dihydroxy-2-butanone-4-phosphate synthase [Nesterenkonia flava]MDR5712663.1 3,4-dihydroxy-2-butanone-4-phosphate synthase [Nesterenkonia flava]